MFSTDIIDQIKNKAREAAHQDESYRSAIDAERSARADLLERVIEAVRPALRALCHRQQTHQEGRIDFGTDDTATTFHEVPALYLGDNGTHPGPVDERPYRDATSGVSGGYDLFLDRTGQLLRFDYVGTWTCWQGSRWSWGATVTEIEVTDVVAMGEDDSAIEAIGRALNRQVTGDKAKRATAATQRAEKIRALLALL